MFARMNHAWQVVGGCLLAPAIATILAIAWVQDWDIPTYTWLLWLQVAIVMFHEFEEYVLPGGFKHFFNHDTIFATGAGGGSQADDASEENSPLSEGYIFFVNIVTVWGWSIAGALLAPVAPWLGFGLVVFNGVVNVIQHGAVFQIRHEGYNPGLITTMVLLIPYTVVMVVYVIQNDVLSPVDWVLSVALGLGVFLSFLVVTLTRRRLATR